jgi:predicted Fe-Mo cluster-binding NifX family protein
MKVVVSSQGDDVDALVSPVFGRCPTYVFVDTATMELEALPNPAMSQGGGAGIQAAQYVVSKGAEAVLSGNLGPKAFDVLQAASVPSYLVIEGTVRQAVEAYQADQLEPMAGANVAAHAGMGRGRGLGRGAQPTTPVLPRTQASPKSELTELRETLKGLRQQLAETMERIEKLEEEG